MGHIELGIDASRLVFVLLAVEREHFTVTALAKPRYAIGVSSTHGTDSGLAQALALRLRVAGDAEREA